MLSINQVCPYASCPAQLWPALNDLALRDITIHLIHLTKHDPNTRAILVSLSPYMAMGNVPVSSK